ncbi:MAG: tetratricopeptide repeat protein [Burkholderiaceae bacterium]|nr:tetratricopeptide repeat protein [Burkholderiaceae bacterium]
MDYYEPMQYLTRVIALAAAMVASPLLAQVQQAAQQPVRTTPEPGAQATTRATNTMFTARLMYELLLAEFSFQDGDPQSGYRFMLDAARRTGDEALFRRATDMAIQSRSGPGALEVARAWREAHPDSVDANRYELQVLLALNRVAETEAPLRATLAALPKDDREDFLAALPQLYSRASDKTEAAHVVEHALDNALKDPAQAAAAWTAIGRLRLQAGDKVGALAAATLGQDADPAARWPALLALQLAAADEPQAESLVQHYLQSAKPLPEVQLAYARWLIDEGRLTDAHAQLAAITARDPEFAEAWLLQGGLYAQQRDDAQAQLALANYMALLKLKGGADASEGMDRARLTLARIAARRGDYPNAEALLDQIETPGQALTVATERAAIRVKQGHLDDAIAAIRAAPDDSPRDTRLKLLAEAQLLRENGRAEQSYQMLNAELRKEPTDEDLIYDTAMSAERMGKPDEMEALLRRLIELKPDAYNAMNALGYSLADRGVRLPEAKSLIEKAVQLAPDNAFIQDSLGWVEFRLGHHAEAERILSEAFRRRPDAEIAAHLGEVLWVQGQTERARAVWREGYRLDPDNDTLKQTLKRLKVRP